LTINTAYTFTVRAATPGGTGPASAASNSVTPALPAIGAAYEGGFYAGQISTTQNGVANFNLVVGPASSAQNTSKQFKTALSFTTGTDSLINGPANSAAENNASHPAGQFCEAVVAGGYSDWYLPADRELEILYYNLKPTTTVIRALSPKTSETFSICCCMIDRPSDKTVSGLGQGFPKRVPMPAARITT
jgi:hypothetical protein